MTDEPEPPADEVPPPSPIGPDPGEAPLLESDPDEAPSAEPESDDRGPSKLALVAVGLVALLAGAGTAMALSRGSSCPGKGNALKVEGTTISAAQYARRIELLQALYDVKPPTEPARLAVFRGDTAKGMAVALLVSKDVAKRNLQVADKTVRDAVDRLIAQRYPQEGRAKFIEALGNQGLSEDDVLGEFRRLLETRSLFQAVTGDVTVGEDQVTKTFEEKKDQLAVPERRRLRHLVVKTEEEAKQALARINGPETFEGVAKAVSLDTSTKDQGGDLGTVSRAQLDPAFGTAAFEAAKGATFGPVQTKNGWHVGFVEDVTGGRPVTLAEVHDQLREALLAEARYAKFRGYVGDLIKNADACYAKGNRPENPKAPPADVTPGPLGPTPTTNP